MEGVLGLVTVFIAAAILLFVGTVVLGNQSLGDCTGLDGWTGSNTNATGWAKQCVDLANDTQDSYGLLGVILVVIAAVAILVIVRML